VFSSWYGMWGPKALPAAIAGRMEQALHRASQDAEVQARMATLNVEPVDEGRAAFARFIAEDTQRNAALLSAAKFQPE
jgi:tripartite-type tricarboxylate transporter receptor subunit TctC